ncbi:MAG: EamA family transporter [FCB group bacterium]|jgi:drug/metabolite transporter (DMT)-like permease
MYILIFIQQLLASGTHIIVKDLTNSLQTPFLLFLRSIIAALFFIGWILFRRKKIIKIDKKDIPVFLLLGLINIPINQFLFFVGVHLSTAPNAALAYALTPAFVLIIAIIFLKESHTWQKILGIIIAIGGTLIILFEHGVDFSSNYLIGNILVLLASFSWAIYTILGKNIAIKYGAMYSTALSMILGFILFLPIFFILKPPLDYSSISIFGWSEIIYLGLLSSAVSYGIWFYALTKIEASKVAVFNNLQPIFTTILAMFFFHQHLTIAFIAGGILILGGVFVTQKG